MSSLFALDTTTADEPFHSLPCDAPVGFRARIGECRQFLWQFLRNPTTVGAIAPSSAGLASAMLKPIDFARVEVIVELGAGTGSFTRYVLRHRQGRTRFLGVEANPRFFAYLTERWERSAFVLGSAERLREVLNDRGIQRADAIVSGLPWASLSRDAQERILHQVFACLSPGGIFVTFAYLQGLLLPAGVRFGNLLRQQFPSVERSKVVWTNLPPAFVYICRKKAPDSPDDPDPIVKQSSARSTQSEGALSAFYQSFRRLLRRESGAISQ